MYGGIIMVRIIIGAIGYAAFFIPVFGGVCNIGTITGLLLFGFVFLSGVFRKRLDPKIKKFARTKAGKIVSGVITAVALFAVATAAAETVCIIAANCCKPATSEVTLVVLGCKVNGSSPSLMLQERIDAAYEFLLNNPEADCVLSGGQGSDENISEAQCMYDALTASGISPARLYLEDNSTSTKENFENSHEIIERYGLKTDIAVVTNEFHEYRAKMLAREIGLGFSAVPAKTAGWLFPTYLVREWYAIIFEVLFR